MPGNFRNSIFLMTFEKTQLEKGIITKYQYTKQPNLSLSQEEKDIFVGVLLGDASLNTQNKGRTYRVKFSVSAKKEEDVDLLYEKLGKWFLSDAHKGARRNQNDNEVVSLTFQTFAHKELNCLADLFLNKQGRKSIPHYLVQNHLNAQGLAFWFSDDGGKLDFRRNEGKAIVLYTNCFTESEVKILADGLIEKFHLECWLKPNKGRYTIGISGRSYETFVDLVNPYLCNCMREKLPSSRKVRTELMT